MAILIDTTTCVVIQGITGREGSRACREMISSGTRIAAGVTPGKRGQNIEGVPVYDSVAQAVAAHPTINASLIAVPAPFALDAALEAISAGIPLINILTEHVPVRDCTVAVAFAQTRGARIVGPSSVGIISPGRAKIGSIGGGGMQGIFTPGPVGIVSKSGGMTAEIAVMLSRNGIGQSTVVGIGGDRIIGSDFVDIFELFARDEETRAIVVFGEVGGAYEERLAEYLMRTRFAKPVVAIIAGKFTTALPQGTVLGHAGSIVEHGRGSHASKERALRKAGVSLAATLEDIPLLLKSLIYDRVKP